MRVFIISILMTQLSLAEDRSEKLKIYAQMSPAEDNPEFVVEFINATSKTLELPSLLSKSSIEFDGAIYQRRTVKFAGNPLLKPGEKWTFTLGPGEYLPVAPDMKGQFSKKLKRFRWKSPVASGKHELKLNFGDFQSDRIIFYWKGDIPLLYE